MDSREFKKQRELKENLLFVHRDRKDHQADGTGDTKASVCVLMWVIA